ncbi:MAG: VTT domain-containing protein [Planctomycetaceae bacterium]
MNRVLKQLPWLILLLLLAVVGWSWFGGGIVFDLLGSDTDAATRVATLKDFFRSFGSAAPLVYVLFVVTEVVVAPIPGLMLYAPGGIVFGSLWGGGLSLLGNVIGAGLACGLTKSLGTHWLTRFFEPQKLDIAQRQIESRGSLLIFLLRLNPLTSSDIVSYAAGFTRLPVWKVMLATGCGMAPLCFAQAWLAEGLITAFPELIYPLAIACGIYVAAVLIVVRRMIAAPA